MGVRIQSDRRQLILSLGEWLGRMSWSHFVTLTTDWYGASAPALERAFDRWCATIQLIAGGPVAWFRAVEPGRIGRNHIHALIEAPPAMRIADLKRPWKAGLTDIVRYDRRRGAAYYVAKAIADPFAEWDISSPLGRAIRGDARTAAPLMGVSRR